jgi:maltose alpha-D-glucosyltransferase / alpha-amylase
MRDRARRRWFENTVVYCLDVATFADGNGDGMGDFVGLIDGLDYISGLGINTLWLLPFQRSPNRDNRYDVSDYYAIDPSLGDAGDVTRLLRECEQRGIRVIVELIVNHTSIDHPWFVEARADRRSPKHDYYVWRDEKPEPGGDLMAPVFPGFEDDIWTWDDEARRYYLHRFYAHQPELNIANPQVRDEIAKIAAFWLDLGVGGFRLDAAPYIVQKASWADDTDQGMWYVRGLREMVSTYGDDAVLLAEADLDPNDYGKYFLDGDGMNVLLNFWSNNHLFLALAREDPRPLVDGLRALTPAPSESSYANWVRNHDELDLEKLEENERNEVLDRFAPGEDERIYGRGIRRRWPPMADGDRRLIELAYSVTFGAPGIPVLLYGEEIGMGDDLSLPERRAVRTAMQWSAGPNGGFSTAAPDELAVPVITDGPFGPSHVNVADQRRDPGSLLNAIHGLVRARREAPELGTGELTVLDDLADHCVLATRYDSERYASVLFHNFTARRVEVPPTSLKDLYDLTELTSDRDYGPIDLDAATLTLEGHGYRWFRGRYDD